MLLGNVLCVSRLRVRTLLIGVALLAGTPSVPVPPSLAQTLDDVGGGARNVVIARGERDGAIEISGSVQLNRVPGPRAGPVNVALATSSCAACQTFAVALQINLIARDAPWIVPENSATAVNYGCSGCYTVARAIQYVLQVDDPTSVPPEVAALARELDLELARLQAQGAQSVQEAEGRIDEVIARYSALAAALAEDREGGV